MKITLLVVFCAVVSACHNRDKNDMVFEVTYSQINAPCVDLGNGLLAMPMIDVFTLNNKDNPAGILCFEIPPFGPNDDNYPKNLVDGKVYTVQIIKNDDIEKQMKDNKLGRIVILQQDIRFK